MRNGCKGVLASVVITCVCNVWDGKGALASYSTSSVIVPARHHITSFHGVRIGHVTRRKRALNTQSTSMIGLEQNASAPRTRPRATEVFSKSI
jgi:hypothetical protein